jgi:hypothetical protein
MDPLAGLDQGQRTWVIEHEALWRRAAAIARKYPDLDPSGVYHVLCNLRRSPEERLRRGLGRLRPDGR